MNIRIVGLSSAVEPSLAFLKAMRCMLFGVAAVVASAPSAYAFPIVAFGSNHYQYVEVTDPFNGSNNSWFAASAAASASTYNSVSGHLATITSAAENSFLLSLTPGYTDFRGAWLGGKAPQGWLVGPEAAQLFGFTNWSGVEPNNAGYAYMLLATGRWADDSGAQGFPDANADRVIGYFIEWEGTNRGVAAPSAIFLLAAGLVPLAVRRRRIRPIGLAPLQWTHERLGHKR